MKKKKGKYGSKMKHLAKCLACEKRFTKKTPNQIYCDKHKHKKKNKDDKLDGITYDKRPVLEQFKEFDGKLKIHPRLPEKTRLQEKAVMKKLKSEDKAKAEPEKAKIQEGIYAFTDYLQMALDFLVIQPLYYDKSKMWWIWNFDLSKWEIIDETDLFNAVDKSLNWGWANVVSSQIRSQIIEALRRKSRLNKPKKIPLSWLQFKDMIYDIKTDETFTATPEWFVQNPIPFEIGKSEKTPTMDKLFEDWVGQKYVKSLYEIIAYCLLPDYPMQRLFCLNGSGSNGKDTYLNLVVKFLGQDNTTSSDLDMLLKSRFESANLYKKLLCTLGETNFATMKKTALLKSLTGRGLNRFEFKGRMTFSDYNYAKIVIASNQLPTTYDKTFGFYRRWFIIDFPNVFSEQRNVLDEIPEVEYNNLANKSIRILKELLDKSEFTNEGTMQDRKQRYEDLSNPLMVFVREKFDRDPNGFIFFSEFYEALTTFLENTGRRKMTATEIGTQLKHESFEKRTKDNKVIIYGLRQKHGSYGSNGSSSTQSLNKRVSETTPITAITPMEKPLIIYHNCRSCGKSECIDYDDTGKPICNECYIKLFE